VLLNISQESALTTPTIVLFSHQATRNAEWDEGRMQGEFGLAADEEGTSAKPGFGHSRS